MPVMIDGSAVMMFCIISLILGVCIGACLLAEDKAAKNRNKKRFPKPLPTHSRLFRPN